MEGIYFYWLTWIGWIYVTFLMERTKSRLLYALILLGAVILSNVEITVLSISINSAIIFYLLGSYFIVAQQKWRKRLYYLCISLILTSSFVAFRLFQLFDPVWVMFHPTFKLSLILLLLTLFLIKEQKIRVALVMITVTQGEFVYTLFIKNLVEQFAIGTLESLDIIAITVSFSFLWFVFENFVQWLDTYVKQKMTFSTQKR